MNTDKKCLKFEMPKMPKIAKSEKQGFIAFDSELRTQNSELFFDADERGSTRIKHEG
jgi:hypothetical protein